MKNNLFKKFLSFSYGSVFGLFIGVLTTIISTRILSPDDFGKASMFLLAMNVCMIFVIFGTDQAFVRFFYEEKEEKRGGLLYNSMKLPVLIAIIVSIILLVFSEEISIFLFSEKNSNMIYLLIVGIFAQYLFRFAVLVIRMQQKGNTFSIIEIIKKILELGLLVGIYFVIGAKYEIIIYSTVITVVLLTVFAIISEKQYWTLKNISINNLRHSKTEIVKYSYPLVLTTLITWLFQAFDKIALRQWSDFEELGLYAAAFKIVALLLVVQTAFTTFWSPVVYEKFEKQPEDKEFFSRTSKIISLSMFAMAIGTIMLKDVIVLLLGPKFAEASLILPFLVFMPMMYTLSETTVIGINFYKKPKWHIVIASAACLLNIIGNWILVPSFGAIGAAISTAISYILFFTLRTIISLKYYKVNYHLGKIYLMLIITCIYGGITIKFNSFIVTLLTGIAALIINIIVYYKEIKNLYRDVKLKKSIK